MDVYALVAQSLRDHPGWTVGQHVDVICPSPHLTEGDWREAGLGGMFRKTKELTVVMVIADVVSGV